MRFGSLSLISRASCWWLLTWSSDSLADLSWKEPQRRR